MMKKKLLIVALAYLVIVLSIDLFYHLNYYHQKARYSTINDTVSNSAYQITRNMNLFMGRLEALKELTSHKDKEDLRVYEKLGKADKQNKADALIILEKEGRELSRINIYKEYEEYSLGATAKRFLPFSLLINSSYTDIPKEFIFLNGVKIYLASLNKTESQNNFSNISSYIEYTTSSTVKLKVSETGNIEIDLSKTNWTDEQKLEFEERINSKIEKYIP